MTLASSMILVDQTSVPLAIPRAIGGLDAAPTLSQWVLTANVLPLAAFMVLGGRLGDLCGLRRMFVAGAVVFTASSAPLARTAPCHGPTSYSTAGVPPATTLTKLSRCFVVQHSKAAVQWRS
jgi:MFS family permease